MARTAPLVISWFIGGIVECVVVPSIAIEADSVATHFDMPITEAQALGLGMIIGIPLSLVVMCWLLSWLDARDTAGRAFEVLLPDERGS